MSALAARILRAMIDDLAMDAALQSHQEISRSRVVCNVCHTRCQAVHVPGPSNIVPPSRADTPLPTDLKLTAETETGTPTGSAGSKSDGTNLLECVNCGRQLAPHRYAPHLSTCMGLATARRGAVRANASVKKQNSEILRSDSPASEAGTMSDDKPAAKGKAKSKNKAIDEAEFDLKRKRPGSPQVSPNKRSKKSRLSGNGSPVSRVLADSETSVVPPASHYSPSANSQTKIPSKLRESSTSLFERSATPTSSRSSSPDGVTATTPASSSFSQSPNIAARVIGNGKSIRSRAPGIGPPRRPTPPLIHVADYSMAVDGGDETGSSTDTDST